MTLEGCTALSDEISKKRLTPTAADASIDVERSEDVGPSGLDRVVLEHRNMLVGGRVEHDVGPEPLEHLEEGLTVVDVDKSLVARSVDQRHRCRGGGSRRGRGGRAWRDRSPATWRQISEPMEPPAPVTSTV